jgi:hypothetical protein
LLASAGNGQAARQPYIPLYTKSPGKKQPQNDAPRILSAKSGILFNLATTGFLHYKPHLMLWYLARILLAAKRHKRHKRLNGFWFYYS